MEHPQPPTPLLCDNEVVIGLATDTINLKLSKSLEMLFHWLRETACAKDTSESIFVPGKTNVADFSTKALAVARDRELAPFFAVDTDDTLHYNTLSLSNLKLLSLLYDAC
jgi:hypothetical protein